MQKKITLFTTNNCSHCERLKAFFDLNNLLYTVFNIEEDWKARTFIVEKTGFLAAPVTQVDKQFIIGYDCNAIEKALRPDLR